MNDAVLASKMDLAKNRIKKALAEYALNWQLLEGSNEQKDLIDFLNIWLEDTTEQLDKLSTKERLFQLANLLSNLEIQIDTLSNKKGWTKTNAANMSLTDLPETLLKVQTLSDSIDQTAQAAN